MFLALPHAPRIAPAPRRSRLVTHGCSRVGAHAQRGVALFVALIMLLLLTLLGVTGMQVANMQERMSASYRAGNMAFQNSEQQLVTSESTLRNQVNSAQPVTATVANCALAYEARQWAITALNAGGTSGNNVRRIDQCFAGSSRKMPQRTNENTNQFYQITAYSVDLPSNPSSRAVVDSVFIP